MLSALRYQAPHSPEHRTLKTLRQLDAIMQSAKLRMEARLAAEQGDFLAATEALESAAGLVGDRMTAGKARDAHADLEAQGGSQFANFQPLDAVD